MKIILGEKYLNYEDALKITSLKTLHDRRSERMAKFAVRCVNDKFNKQIFPLNKNTKNKEVFKVNFARTNKYLKSAVPQCQRILNRIAEQNPDFTPNI